MCIEADEFSHTGIRFFVVIVVWLSRLWIREALHLLLGWLSLNLLMNVLRFHSISLISLTGRRWKNYLGRSRVPTDKKRLIWAIVDGRSHSIVAIVNNASLKLSDLFLKLSDKAFVGKSSLDECSDTIMIFITMELDITTHAHYLHPWAPVTPMVDDCILIFEVFSTT